MVTKKVDSKPKYVHPYDKLTNAGYVFVTSSHRGPVALYSIKAHAQELVDYYHKQGYPAKVVKAIRGTPISKDEQFPNTYMVAWKPR